MEENHKLIKQSTNFWRTEGANEYFVLPFYIDALNNFKVARVDGGAWRHSRKRPPRFCPKPNLPKIIYRLHRINAPRNHGQVLFRFNPGFLGFDESRDPGNNWVSARFISSIFGGKYEGETISLASLILRR